MRFAFITPRYGADIAGGAEHACRLLAEQVSARHEVDVLTTCARDPLTWKNEYAEGADRVRGVLLRRFAVSQPHDGAGVRRAHGSNVVVAAIARSEEIALGPAARSVCRTGCWNHLEAVSIAATSASCSFR